MSNEKQKMINRGGGNRLNNRRIQGGFPNNNRGPSGVKPNQKQGAGGIRKQNAFDRAKKLLAKNANNKQKKDFTPGDKKPESRESPYASVPNDMFYCHLCKKHMWDANSFENHIKGRTHLMMREGIEESYRLKANMIRQEAKIAEQLKSIELDRLKRMGKTKQRQLEYCTMCDLNFHGHISAHRKSDGHLQLKKFLHPKCIECNKEFATRIDFDSHLLSAEHLIKAAEKNTKVGERKCNTLQILTEEEELKDVRQPQKRRKIKPATDNDVSMTDVTIKKEAGTEEADNSNAVENATEGDGAAAKANTSVAATDETKEAGDENNDAQDEEDALPPVDPEDCILDYADVEEIPIEVENRLPKYNWTRPVGCNLITKLECYECSLCSKFFDTQKTVEIHSRTVTHHRNFLKFINEKSSDTKIAQKRAAAATEESERKRRKMEEADSSNVEIGTTNIKIEQTNDGGEGETEADANGDNEGQGEDGNENGMNAEDENEDLYDPMEATGDDEDIAENGNDTADDIGEFDDDDQGEQISQTEEDELLSFHQTDEADAVAEPKAKVAPQTPAKAAVGQVASTPVQTKVEIKQEISTPVKTPAKTPVKAQATSTTTPTATATAAAATSPANNSNNNSNNNTPVQNQQVEQTNNNNSNKKGGPRGGGNMGQGKGTPRGRGRGRYSRY